MGGTDYPRAPLWAWEARMDAADDFADGILAMSLPIEDRNAGSEAGRWAWKGVACSAPDDADCSLGDGNTARLAEQRNTVPHVGAREEFDAYLADNDTACEGVYQVDVDVTAPTTTPKLHWWVFRYDGAINSYEGNDYAARDSGDTGVLVYHADVDFDAFLGDTLRPYWVSEGGGASPTAATRMTFTVTPPKSGCAIDWSHTSAVDTGYPEDTGASGLVIRPHVFATTPNAIYNCITGRWTGAGCP